MTDFEIPTSARQVHLASRPEGALSTENFRFVEVSVDFPRAGHVLVRNEQLALAAVMRERMDPDAELPPALPLYELDQPLTAFAVGTVIASGNDDVPVGALVAHESPWADYADATDVIPLPGDAMPGPEYFLATGNGSTALLGVRDVAEVGAGDIVLVSGAAGGVGSLAGQIARKLGAAKVIGTAGSARKCAWLVDEIGFDEAIDYHDEDFVDQLRKAAPEGISVYIDLVGGMQFEAAVEVAATHARFAVGGALAAQQSGAEWPRFDTQTAILKNLTVKAFALQYALQVMGEFPGLFGQWVAEGMVYPHTVIDGGLDSAPQGLIDLLGSKYTGNVSVRLCS